MVWFDFDMLALKRCYVFTITAAHSPEKKVISAIYLGGIDVSNNKQFCYHSALSESPNFFGLQKQSAFSLI